MRGMSILWAVFIGLIVGIVAKLLMPGRDPGGFIITILLGVGGSLLANFLGHNMGFYQANETAGFFSSVIGAIVILVLRVIGTKADVRQTVPAALYCFLKFDNYHDAVLASIKAGGDTDTTAAIVGALFGAKYGMKVIDKDLVKGVEESDRLIELDSQLYNRSKDSFLTRG